MIEYYNKVKEGFEYCRANLEGDISYDQFMACQQLCKNLHKLCEFYLSKLDKGNYEYAKDVWQGYLNTLLGMVQSWQDQWDKMNAEEEADEAKKKDIWMQLMVADEFTKYKEKRDKKEKTCQPRSSSLLTVRLYNKRKRIYLRKCKQKETKL